uniref:Reverse transcriptase N-terminal domain-containing protein n=1 Tax=Spyridia filamentosa TaxID=196632 RepID=A0A1Z1MK34_SPYFI|nr:hypothetical protein [Spyridia filamentosa]ARW66185.1 hypothetical protein [Spyridia filamentosa]
MFCYFNFNIQWQFLPWHKINARLIMLQNRIRKASKNSNKSELNIIQNYLLNSLEARLLAVDEIINSMNNFSSKKNMKYILSNKDKWTIFNCIYNSLSFNDKDNKYINKLTKILVSKVKQRLIYFCLEPEWEPRIDSNNWLIKAINKSLVIEKNNCISLNIKILHQFKICMNCKYINDFLLIKKINSIPCINKAILKWIKFSSLRFCFTQSSFDINFYNKSLNTNFEWYNKLLNLILKILYIDCQWSMFTYDIFSINIKTYLKHHIKYLDNVNQFFFLQTSNQGNIFYNYKAISMNFSHDICKLFNLNYSRYIYYKKQYRKFNIFKGFSQYLLKSINFILYHRNKVNKLITNNYFRVDHLFQQINNLILDYWKFRKTILCFYCNAISLNALNAAITYWCIKQKKDLINIMPKIYIDIAYLNTVFFKKNLIYNYHNIMLMH